MSTDVEIAENGAAVHVQDPPDLVVAERAATAFLTALGVPLDSPHCRDTPRRMASAFAELLTPPRFVPTMFRSDSYEGLVVVRGIAFASLCAHHGLPFIGTVDVGYQPAGQIIGLSKLAWAVHLYARRLQVQEQLTGHVADWLVDTLQPRAAGVRVQAEHLCMSLRGARARGAVTVTSATRGALVDDPLLRQEWVMHLGAAVAGAHDCQGQETRDVSDQ
ncbi:GTP cyclohydrolase I FolE [Micromonospora sp. Llam7]|uniref:GTP cyclohydrolase I n=1 Tax=Micromonospora tarapacensis TaxID=2835305 RepID=UPI001C83AE58|nr:GTP cyclohydrolase I FolE [Micromonospora tarapacensis]MBX7267527.1 GTP cyclohydrolase I FolE [Micromonospora tarapacensis]